MLKGGFGLIDAPNLFTSRVDEIFVANGVKPTCSEPKIYLRLNATNKSRYGVGESGGHSHSVLGLGNSNILDLMVSAHMDDFKATGSQTSLNWLREILSKSFGGDVKMEQESSFIHTGIRHTKVQGKQNESYHVELDQNE